jgi:membrane-associated protease RseP (regulator of RpoE activity)
LSELPENPPFPLQDFVWTPPPPRLKFQHRYRIHVILFVLTVVTTTVAGTLSYADLSSIAGRPIDTWSMLLSTLARGLPFGLWYSLPVLFILGCHEFGHYYYCRVHNVDASLPFFIPAPPPLLLTGTFGAVIRIREPFPSKQALFDIGIAGPIAGFLALVPILYFGVALSKIAPIPQNADLIYFGEPLLFKAMSWLHFGRIPEGSDMMLHPLGFAGWLGMLVTALNLLPFGQLDGGHIMYAVLGRRAARVSVATVAVTALLTLHSMSWIATTLMMLGMAYFLGFRHPKIVDEHVPLDGRRKLVAVAALIIFILCFTPVPIETFFGK